ncbi:MAG: hypothetical protein ACYSSI_05530 [Planctomycetota bacterium]|jgi:hypothetical protein
MINLLAQAVLAARHKDESDWTQFLVFGLVAVFWIISGIIKAKSGKTDSEQRQQEAAALKKRRQELKAQRQAVKAAIPERPRKPSRPIRQPQPQKTTVGQLYPEIIPKPVQPIPEIKEKTTDSSLGMQDIDLRSRQVETEAAKWAFDFDDTEKLKRAILYHEILGKPLSLRAGDNW